MNFSIHLSNWFYHLRCIGFYSIYTLKRLLVWSKQSDPYKNMIHKALSNCYFINKNSLRCILQSNLSTNINLNSIAVVSPNSNSEVLPIYDDSKTFVNASSPPSLRSAVVNHIAIPMDYEPRRVGYPMSNGDISNGSHFKNEGEKYFHKKSFRSNFRLIVVIRS